MVLALAAPSAGRVSHVTGDHTSLLKLIENRVMPGVHLTKRDQYANDLESMFDFNNSPSLNTVGDRRSLHRMTALHGQE